MALVDQFGNTISYKAAAAANRYTRERPWEPVQLSDIDDLIPSIDRKTLLSASRRLFLNLGPARGAIEQKAMYAVGRAWLPIFTGSDNEFAFEAKNWLTDQWYVTGDVRGGMHDFRTALYNISVAIDRDGEAFVLLTETQNGYPRYQHIPAHRIATPKDIEDGPYRGGNLRDGIVYYQSGAPKEYALIDSEGKLVEWLGADSIVHLFDPSFQEQGRGLPAFTHALNDLRDMLQSHVWERQAQLMMSTIGLIEYNDNGGPDTDDPGAILRGDNTTNEGVVLEKLDGGSVRYFKSNSGGKIETIKSDRPGNAWENFHDRIIRSALSGINWPYSLVWKSTGQGTAERAEIGKAQRAVEDRQDLIFYAAKRMVGYAIAKAQKYGLLSASPDWYKWKFTYPRKLTIDDGRVAQELENGWKNGWLNHTDILGMFGKTLEEHYQERAEEVAMRKLAAQQASEIYGVSVDEREMALITPNEQPQQKGEPIQQMPNQTTQTSEED